MSIFSSIGHALEHVGQDIEHGVEGYAQTMLSQNPVSEFANMLEGASGGGASPLGGSPMLGEASSLLKGGSLGELLPIAARLAPLALL